MPVRPHLACPIPATVRQYSLGPHLAAMAVYFIGSFGLSKRTVEVLTESLFRAPVALGTL